MSDSHLRDDKGIRYATPELAEAATRQNQRNDAERQERERAEAAARRTALEGSLRDRFLAAGGTAQEFDQEKDSLVRDHLRAETLAADSQARRLNAARYAN